MQCFTVAAEMTFSRVTADTPIGAFVVDAEEIEGLTPREIQIHLALLDTPTHILDVTVPVGTRMQAGIVSAQPNYGAPTNGGMFYQIMDPIAPANFGPLRPLKPFKPLKPLGPLVAARAWLAGKAKPQRPAAFGKVELPSGGVVLLDRMTDAGAYSHDERARNIFRADTKGNTIWCVQTGSDAYGDPFTQIYYNHGLLRAYRWNGLVFEIDMNTGEAGPVALAK